MSHMFASSRDEQAKLLDEALQAVKVQAFQMKRYVDNDRLIDGLRHCSTMLNELRTSALTPKNYYELYLAIFDALQYLIGAVRAAHFAGRNHLADLYELAQYAGSIVPRLYLMITIGSAYMSLAVPSAQGDETQAQAQAQTQARGRGRGDEAVPVREIMMDMLEMVRGVQHPTRGLFLRYYLGQMTKDYLPIKPESGGGGGGGGGGGSLEDSTHFTLTNFVEMNKLWVRLQHQGQSRERERREAERRDLRTLVGSNLLRLASLPELPRAAYEETILPKLLSQVVSCRDTLAQEYLMEALVQAFSDEWHLATVGQLMEAISGLGPKVSIKSIVIPLVDRVSSYAGRRREELEKLEKLERQEKLEKLERLEEARASGSSGAAAEESAPAEEAVESVEPAEPAEPAEPVETGDADKPDADAAEPTGETAEEPTDKTPDKTTTDEPEGEPNGEPNGEPDGEPEAIPSVVGAMAAASLEERGPEETTIQEQPAGGATQSPGAARASSELDSLASLFDSFWGHVNGLIEARPDLALHDAVAICASMLRLSLSCNPQPVEPVDGVLAFVRGLLRARDLSPGAHSSATGNQLLGLLLGPLRAYASPLKVLELGNYAPLLESQAERTRRSVAVALLTAILQRGTTMRTEAEVAGVTRLCMSLIRRPEPAAAGAAGAAEQAESPLDEEDLAEEQGLLARLVHLIRAPDAVAQLRLLGVARDAFSQGAGLARYTYPAVIAGATRLLGPYAAAVPDDDGGPARGEWDRRVRQLCRFIQATIAALVERAAGAPAAAEVALQLALLAAQAASVPAGFRDKPALEEAAYELLVQALTVYEEHVSDSRAQYQALILIINALHASRSLSPDNYETLAARCAQHAARLLKRPDQARAACACAQLWWRMLPYSELIPPSADPAQPQDAGAGAAAAERAHAERVERERAAVERHNNGDAVLAHLQRALKAADACLDPVLSVRLFVELLNQSAMHYERRCLAITPKYINDLIDLIRTTIAGIEAFDASAPEPTRAAATSAAGAGSDAATADANALYTPPGPMHAYVLAYFRRTLDYIQSRKDLAATGDYNLPDFSAIHCDEPDEQHEAGGYY
ncbi:retromer complex subunit Vps35 [Coemansia javaensis]|uniref:Retromer complex subunit Vps35 n=1 Tax=Coemansia javaensis TaxID=2761396 RepID=A0A9W8HAC4_9FUNG|nr:retromer complex subunit Vps35 [Coemansia javaensis]